MDDDAHRPSGTDGDGGLDVEILLDDALADLVGAFGHRPADRLDEVALVAAEGDLAADTERRGHRDALQQRPGVVIDLVLETA